MVCLIANHYTAKAFCFIGFSIWGSGGRAHIDKDGSTGINSIGRFEHSQPVLLEPSEGRTLIKCLPAAGLGPTRNPRPTASPDVGSTRVRALRSTPASRIAGTPSVLVRSDPHVSSRPTRIDTVCRARAGAPRFVGRIKPVLGGRQRPSRRRGSRARSAARPNPIARRSSMTNENYSAPGAVKLTMGVARPRPEDYCMHVQ